MKKVKLLVNTAYQGPRKEGDVISVPDDFAARWVKNGIAVLAEEVEETEDVEEVVEEEVQEEEVEETPDYSGMNAKELYAICKEKGIEVEPKQSKEYYLEKLA